MKPSKLSTIRDARLKVTKPYTKRDLATNLYNFISYSKIEGTPLNWLLKTFSGYLIEDVLQAVGELSMNGDIVLRAKGVYTIAKYARHPRIVLSVPTITFGIGVGTDKKIGLGQIKEPWQMTQEQYVISYATAREKAHVMYGKPAGKTLDIALVVEMAKESHEKMVEDALQKGFPVPMEVLTDYPDLMPVIEKDTWQMTKTEYLNYREQLLVGSKAQSPELCYRNLPPKHSREMWKTQMLKYHKEDIKDAIAEGKPVPIEVLKEYPDLKRKPKPKPRPLPPDAQNIQSVPFDSTLFDCYGKQTKRGFRAYCRRK